MEQVQKTRQTEKATSTKEETPADSHRADKIKSELDDLLDEIDSVLVENAAEFVESYRQKGGQ